MHPLKILFISPYLPSPIHVRPYNFIKFLAKRGHHITLLALLPPGESTDSLSDLEDWCTAVHTVAHPRWRTLWNGVTAIPSRTPFQAAYSRSPQLAKLIRQTEATGDFDVVHVEHLRGAEPSRAIQNTPIVFDAVDSISLLFERVLKSPPTRRSQLMAQLDIARTRTYEAELPARFNRVLVTSARDRDALANLSAVPAETRRLVVIPNGVDLEYFSPQATPRDPATIIFSGKMSYHANIAAGIDLATQIMPLVWRKFPDTKLTIAGKDPSAELLALDTDARIEITGTVADLRPYLARATIAVSPIRYGVGIQNKVMEAMAMRTPVVSSPQAISALDVAVGNDLLVGSTPPEIAAAIIALLEHPRYREEIGAAGRRFVETHHSWDSAAEMLENVYLMVIEEKTTQPM